MTKVDLTFKNFFSELIFLPSHAATLKEQTKAKVISVVLGIFTLGTIHAAVGLGWIARAIVNWIKSQFSSTDQKAQKVSGVINQNPLDLQELYGSKASEVINQHYSASTNVKDDDLIKLKGMPLTSLKFIDCSELTDEGLEHLKGMPLTSVDFIFCPKLTDKGLEHLKGMPLTSVDFSDCPELTDKGLEHLKGMPLTSVKFIDCPELTDEGLEHLKGMPLTSVNFIYCPELTDKGLEHLKGMPLTSVELRAALALNLQTKGLSILKECR